MKSLQLGPEDSKKVQKLAKNLSLPFQEVAKTFVICDFDIKRTTRRLLSDPKRIEKISTNAPYNPKQVQPLTSASEIEEACVRKFQQEYLDVFDRPKIKRKKKVRNEETNEIEIKQVDDEFDFVPYFTEFMKLQLNVIFERNLKEAFSNMLKTKSLLAIHSLFLTERPPPRSNLHEYMQHDLRNAHIRQIYKCVAIAKVMNMDVINYGLDPTQFDWDMHPFMRRFVNEEEDRNCLIVLRMNQRNYEVETALRVEILTDISIRDISGFQKLMQNMRRENVAKGKNEVMSRLGSTSEKSKKKMEEDRVLRERQDQEYNLMMERRKPVDLDEPTQPEEGVKKQSLADVVGEQQQPELEQKITLTDYNIHKLKDPIHIKLRFPNGKDRVRPLPKTETVAYIYHYIRNLKEDLGFDRLPRSFVLAVPGQNMYIWQSQQKLEQVLKGANHQLLIVSQIL